MTNIVKETLLEKQATLLDSIDGLVAAEKQIILNRAKEAFVEALDFLPVELTMGYDTIYFKVEGKEILSINSKYEKQYYLNTYSTWIESGFELQRLIFNGMVAKVVLANPNVYNGIFAKTELREEIAVLKGQLYAIKREVEAINVAEAAKAKEEKKAKLVAGEEIEFDKLQTIMYGHGRFKAVDRVKAIKVEMTSKVKGTVTFKLQNYFEETFQTYTKENINIDRYILPYIN
jgi:hypothetical protein